MELREYQKKEVEAVFRAFNEGHNALIVAATGTGKTICFAEVTKRLVADNKRVLILAHRAELLEQTQEKLLRFNVMSALEKASDSASTYDNVVVASIQTLYRDERLNRFDKNHFDVIIVDECHHIMSDTYQKVINYFESALILGVTATPNRSDMRSLSKVFPEVSYSYNTRDAINDGYLVPVNVKRLPLSIDMSDVRTTAGDYNSSDLETALDPYLDEIARVLHEEAAHKKTLIFTPTIAIADKMAQNLRENGFSAASVHSQVDNREELLRKFSEGEITVTVNPLILTEGYDEPTVDCIVNLRATKSESLFKQILGRGLRLSPDTGKESLLYLDFLWNTSKKSNKNVLNPVSLFIDEKDGQFLDDEDLKEEIDIFDLEETLIQRRIDAEEALAEKLKMAAKKRYLPGSFVRFMEIEDEHLKYFYDESGDSLVLNSVVYCADPFVEFITGEKNFEWVPIFKNDCEPITPKQKEFLIKLGVANIDLIQFKGQASKLIEAATARKEKNLCSFKQASLLTKKGFKHVERWTPTQCSYVIDKIAKNKWKVPKEFWPIPKYKPNDNALAFGLKSKKGEK